MFLSSKRKFPNRIIGKYVQINYINSEGIAVRVSGKVKEIELNGNDYSRFKMNPIVGLQEGKYKLVNTCKDDNYLIPPGCLGIITENVTKKSLEKLCEVYNTNQEETIQNSSEENEEKNNPTERLVVKGYLNHS